MIRLDLQFFGGRGAGSKKKGGTDLPKNVNVVSTESLVSMREDGKRTEVDETLEVFRDVTDEYGAIVEDIRVAKLSGQGSGGVLAYYDSDDNVAINEKFFDKAKMEKAYANSVASGYHPPTGDKTAMQAVVAHELGHKLTQEVTGKMNATSLHDAADRVVSEATRRARGKLSTGKISGYAKENSAEAIAEAFADVYCNGRKASKESRTIVGVLRKYAKP